MTHRNRQIADETMTIISSGGYQTTAGANVRIAEKIALAVAGTRLYRPEDPLPAGAGRIEGRPLIEVTPETTLSAAQRLGGDVACLPGLRVGQESRRRIPQRSTSPGGGPGSGVRAVCLPDDGTGVLHLPPGPARPPLQRPRDIAQVLRTRAARILDIAAAHGHRSIVLGAWGCGVFRNDPAVVAGIFADTVRDNGRFDRVVFAIFDRLPGTPVRSAFVQRFGRSAARASHA